jgi:hypothetical protein
MPALPATASLGFLLQVDATSIESFAPTDAHLQTTEDRVTSLGLVDDGVEPDAIAGDAIFTSPVPHFGAPQATFSVSSGEQTWATTIQINADKDKPVVRIRLAPNGVATQEDMSPPSSAPPTPSGAPADGPSGGPARRAAPSDPVSLPSRIQWAIWAAALFAAGLMAGIAFSGAWPTGERTRRARRHR